MEVTTPFAYGDPTSYQKGIAFLDGHGLIEDWGCGVCFAKLFVHNSEYRGIDSSRSKFVDVVADLASYRSQPDCIFMRHVLEHNWTWPTILENALASFRDRMALIIFTPFAETTTEIAHVDGICELSLNRTEVQKALEPFAVRREEITSQTRYGAEVLFYIERKE